MAKIVDDIIITGFAYIELRVVKEIYVTFALGSIANGPDHMLFFGLNIEQMDDFSVQTNCDDKLNQLEAYPLSRFRRSQIDQDINPIEKKSFASLNSSTGWMVCNNIFAFLCIIL